MKEIIPKNKNCSKCGEQFSCKSIEGGCWCNNYNLSNEKLKYLKDNYDNCLCEKCIASIAELPSKNT